MEHWWYENDTKPLLLKTEIDFQYNSKV